MTEDFNAEIPISYWNYRVFKVEDEFEGVVFTSFIVYETYYDENGEIVGYCEASVLSETENGLHDELDKISEALTKPIVDEKSLKEIIN